MPDEPARKLGREPELHIKRYSATVSGPHKFHGVDPGDRIILEVPDHEINRYLESGRITDLEEVGETDEVADPDPTHGDPPVDTVHGEDAAHVEVKDEAGPEPEHK